MAQARARKGGETGMNGEFYEGGEFLPNTDLASRAKGARKPFKAGKRQVAPYVWEFQPYEGARAIFTLFAGIFGKVVDGKMIVNCSDQTLDYYKTTRNEAQAMADAWNNGERWV